ncbi:haloacid dehalogenase [Colletotrichum godetiae]|uniref:Haloacid dehalogenase n=1 Tax=Colletotrichum godetiae TaxID=1209918 RepID=A0AAJ0ADJ8_9PEZI|nr:haloacid dehalogenase [Colletotrichum godetiae]KAK1659737.1 haloacid dehalogenase [Colletotrichum godetiae]
MAQDKHKTVIAFDLYGTLLSTESIAKQLAELYGDEDEAKTMAAQWRRYQLEYTWRINSMGTYHPFSDITRAALKHAVAERKKSPMSKGDEDRLMEAYNGLQAFPDVEPAMRIVEGDNSIDAYVFSNGTNDMVGASIRTCPEINQRKSRIFGPENLVTVEGAGCFKPAPATYRHFAETVGMTGREGDIWIVSSNPFDALGARAVGWQSAWIDRAGTGWIDALGSLIDTKPTVVARGVDEALQRIAELSK